MKNTKKIVVLNLVILIFFACLAASLTSEKDIDPPSYEPYEEMNHLHIGINIRELSADNETDWLYYRFPDSIILDPNSVETNLTVSSEEELKDFDRDGIRETVLVGVNSDRGGNVSTRVVLDTAANFTGFGDKNIVTEVQDSRYGNASTEVVILFGGNPSYYRHIQEEKHNHSHDFSDAFVKCPRGHLCPEIPNPVYHLKKLIKI